MGSESTSKRVPKKEEAVQSHLFACLSLRQVSSEAGCGWHHAHDACHHVHDAFRPGVPRTLSADVGSPEGDPLPPLLLVQTEKQMARADMDNDLEQYE